MGIDEIYNTIGSLICHQLPERTISASGIPLPVCARDTGIYLGVFTGLMFAVSTRRMKSDKQPSIPLAVVLCFFMLPMIVDGLGSYLGLFHSNNTTRIYTGALFGLCLQFFLIPLANFKIDGRNEKRIIKNPIELTLVIAVLMLTCTFVLKQLIPYFILGTIIVGSIFFLIGRLVFTILALAWPAKRSVLYLKTIGAASIVFIGMYLLSKYILQPLKAILLER